jgi:hypothetical protein
VISELADQVTTNIATSKYGDQRFLVWFNEKLGGIDGTEVSLQIK